MTPVVKEDNRYVTVETCMANTSNIIQRQDDVLKRLDKHTDTFTKITTKLENILVEQKAHAAFHKGMEKAQANISQDSRSAEAKRTFLLKLLALIFSVLVVVGGVAWTMASIVSPTTEDVAKEVVKELQKGGAP